MAYLKYDIDKMLEVKQVYADAVSKMTEIQKTMQKMVDSVKDGWDSDAGKAFFEKYDEEWLKGFTQYKQVLRHMSENLNTAQGKYNEVTELAKKTKLDL